MSPRSIRIHSSKVPMHNKREIGRLHCTISEHYILRSCIDWRRQIWFFFCSILLGQRKNLKLVEAAAWNGASIWCTSLRDTREKKQKIMESALNGTFTLGKVVPFNRLPFDLPLTSAIALPSMRHKHTHLHKGTSASKSCSCTMHIVLVSLLLLSWDERFIDDDNDDIRGLWTRFYLDCACVSVRGCKRSMRQASRAINYLNESKSHWNGRMINSKYI